LAEEQRRIAGTDHAQVYGKRERVDGAPCQRWLSMTGNDALAVLRGRHLDTVSFVMDYVEFRIGYNALRALTRETPVRLTHPREG
jgi:hypothetical protein